MANETRLKLFAAGIMLIVLTSLIFQASLVYATDNTTSQHWHSESPDFKLLTDQLPDSWEDAIEEAAEAWSDDTNIDISEDTSSGNEIYRGSIPAAWLGSCSSTAAACTGITYNTVTNHISAATMLFNEDISMGTSSFNCLFDIGIDVQTIALHEFGHFMGLDDSTDSDAAMYETVNDCQRTPDDHDIDSMNDQYDGHP